MTIEQAVLETLRGLRPEQQREVLDFAEFLKGKSVAKGPRQAVKGLWASQGVRITEEDIAEARREMWGNFPREDF
jgi:hypothetical protein